jgi:hypothetical protein
LSKRINDPGREIAVAFGMNVIAPDSESLRPVDGTSCGCEKHAGRRAFAAMNGTYAMNTDTMQQCAQDRFPTIPWKDKRQYPTA